MQAAGWFDGVPLWGVLLGTVAALLGSSEAAFRVGRYRRRRSALEDKPPVGEVVAATLGLLAFILAFTFGLAASWFDRRRTLVVDEANAIGTTFLRAGLLPEPQRTEVRALLKEYVEARLEAVERGGLARGVRHSEALQGRLWAQAEAVGRAERDSPVVALFIASLNDTIDRHAERLAFGPRTRLPAVIWQTLYLVALLGTGALGYHAGLSDSTRSLALPALVVAFAAVLTLIVDLDRPQEGMLRVSQQAIIDLKRSFAAPP